MLWMSAGSRHLKESTMTNATLILGRDGLGSDADEAFFDQWVGYVSERIDEATGLDVAVETRSARDAQADSIVADDEVTRVTVAEAKNALWERFCSEAS